MLLARLLLLRKMIHSTSLRATGSEMVAATWVALSAPPRRRLSIALLTSATSASGVSGISACAGGSVGSSRASRAPDAGAVLRDADCFSLDLAAAAFFPAGFALLFAPFLPTAFAIAASGFSVSPWAAAAGAAVQ